MSAEVKTVVDQEVEDVAAAAVEDAHKKADIQLRCRSIARQCEQVRAMGGEKELATALKFYAQAK